MTVDPLVGRPCPRTFVWSLVEAAHTAAVNPRHEAPLPRAGNHYSAGVPRHAPSITVISQAPESAGSRANAAGIASISASLGVIG